MAELFEILEQVRDPRDLVVYCLVRTDLPSMNHGKALAQVFHAGNQILKHKDQQVVKDYIAKAETEGADSFGTCITLSCTKKQLDFVVQTATALRIVHDVVTDPSYPFWVDEETAPLVGDDAYNTGIKVDGRVLFHRSEVTCAWLIGDRKEFMFRQLVTGLELHP